MAATDGARVLGLSASALAFSRACVSRLLDRLGPILTCHGGYRVGDLVEQFDAKPAEIDAFFSNSLAPVRAASTASMARSDIGNLRQIQIHARRHRRFR
ncbi:MULTISPECIES: hypothetical protein [Burkholderia cepacia complex]|uniref:hypothetical protein n=1 Tax=Burkholderia cepacia complex TaxID=87882 RepID=UPI001ABADEB5|nr:MULTISPECIES: hypothetical protein [Burkholderia cepacia complex]